MDRWFSSAGSFNIDGQFAYTLPDKTCLEVKGNDRIHEIVKRASWVSVAAVQILAVCWEKGERRNAECAREAGRAREVALGKLQLSFPKVSGHDRTKQNYAGWILKSKVKPVRIAERQWLHEKTYLSRQRKLWSPRKTLPWFRNLSIKRRTHDRSEKHQKVFHRQFTQKCQN